MIGAAVAHGRMTERMIGFLAHLRANDFRLGPSETKAALDLLGRGDVGLDRAKLGLRILLSSRKDEWDRFDDLFEAYWFRRGRTRSSAKERPRGQTAGHPKIWRNHFDEDLSGAKGGDGPITAAGDDDRAAEGGAGRLIASRQHALTKADLRTLADPEEIASAERLAYRLARAVRYRLARRYRVDHQGSRLDLRRTIRANLSAGGEPIALVEKSRPDRPVRLVVLLDVSGSMQPYSRFFLQFVKGLVCSWVETDAYLFHTRLVRVTDAVRERDSVKAMARLSLMAEGFGGGTKLGACLKTFNDRYAKTALNSRTVFVMMSDGYDTGSCEPLVAELARLKRRVRRLVWLNPLLGWRRYEPVNQAMTAAMPFIDHFAAAHSLESLAAVEADLARL